MKTVKLFSKLSLLFFLFLLISCGGTVKITTIIITIESTSKSLLSATDIGFKIHDDIGEKETVSGQSSGGILVDTRMINTAPTYFTDLSLKTCPSMVPVTWNGSAYYQMHPDLQSIIDKLVDVGGEDLRTKVSNQFTAVGLSTSYIKFTAWAIVWVNCETGNVEKVDHS